MPVMDGWEFMEAFKALTDESLKTVAVFMVSSSIYEEDTERAKTYKQIKQYIQKPLNKEKIMSILSLSV
jgi:CheY-like chemotaxis protein